MLRTLFGGLLFFSVLQTVVAGGRTVMLIWNPSLDPNIADYNVYYGVASRSYTNMVSVGSATNATISGLVEGATYHFAATAVNILGVESDYSNEAVYTVPVSVARLQLRAASAGQMVLTLSGLAGHTYEIQATQTFTNWTVIGTVTLGAGGALVFTDTNAASFSRRFYRIRDVVP